MIPALASGIVSKAVPIGGTGTFTVGPFEVSGDSVDNVSLGYQGFKSLDGVNWTYDGTIDNLADSYTFNSLTNATHWYFKVNSYNANGLSPDGYTAEADIA